MKRPPPFSNKLGISGAIPLLPLYAFMVRIGQLCLFNFSGLKWPEHEVDRLYLVPSLRMSGNVPLLCLHILMAQTGQCCLFQSVLPINFSHNFAKDL